MRYSLLALIVATSLLAFLALTLGRDADGSASNSEAAEVARLRYANTLLQTKVSAYEARIAELQDERFARAREELRPSGGRRRGRRGAPVEAPPVCPVCRTESELAAPPPSPAAHLVGSGSRDSTNSTDLAALLLRAHSSWDWQAIVRELLQPWPRIEQQQLETAVAACNDNGTMYCQRMQIIGGNLYLTDYRAIFFDRHYAPARVLPLLETLRRHPNLPDMDIVVAGNDEPRVPAQPGDRYSWARTCKRWPGSSGFGSASGDGRLPPAIFASTINRAVFDLPWLDFAWFFPTRPHKLRTPPWSKLHPSLLAAGGSVRWEDKIELAMHTGNVGSPYRKILSEQARRSPQEVLVNELFIGDHGKIRSTCAQLGLHRKGGFQQHKCYMTFAEQCGYKYLLNSASIGYANKFKSLLLCGSVVIYVREGMRHKEFYEYGLVSGVHYVSVDTAADVPAMVHWLKEHDDYARAVALAGRARMSTLDVSALTEFMAETLKAYASRQGFRPRVQAGAVRIDCADDLWRHYSLSKPWMEAYLTHDNSSCAGLPAPSPLPAPPPLPFVGSPTRHPSLPTQSRRPPALSTDMVAATRLFLPCSRRPSDSQGRNPRPAGLGRCVRRLEASLLRVTRPGSEGAAASVRFQQALQHVGELRTVRPVAEASPGRRCALAQLILLFP